MIPERFVHEGRPLRDWLLQLVEDTPDRRREASKVVTDRFYMPMELLLQPGAKTESIVAGFNDAVRQVVALPDFPAEDYVRQLFTLSMALESKRLDEWRVENEIEDEWHDAQAAKLTQTPTVAGFLRYLKRCYIRLLRQCEKTNKSPGNESFETGMTIGHVVDALGPELLPAAPLIRHMLKETHQGYMASSAICRMGAAAAEFYPDLIKGLEKRDANHEFCKPLGMLLRHFPDRVQDVFSRIDDPKVEIRGNAIAALGYCGRDTLRNFHAIESELRRRLAKRKDDPEGDWYASAVALAEIGTTSDSVTVLLDCTYPSTGGVAGVAIDCLGRMGLEPDRVVPRLIALLDEFEEYDTDWFYFGDHARVVSALEKFGEYSRPAIPRLARCIWKASSLQDGLYTETNQNIVRFLAMHGPAAAEALPELMAVRAEFIRRGREAEKANFKADEQTAPPSDDDLCGDELINAIRKISGA